MRSRKGHVVEGSRQVAQQDAASEAGLGTSGGRARSLAFALAAPVVMLLGIVAVYCPAACFTGQRRLVGIDYHALHERRIRYAQDALFGPQPHLPGWYSRELLGTPFWSNTESFPFLPTRLLILPFDTGMAYLVAVNLAAALSGWFTYLFARRLGVGRVGAAVAGWTFACAGYFAARVTAGHLSFLEVYPALPLLLWLAEAYLQAPAAGRRSSFTLLALGIASGCASLAGHPQLPLYAIAATLLYLVCTAGGRGGLRRGLTGAAAVLLGAGLSAFAMWPMLELIGRSTRVLALDPSANDIPFPTDRLLAFLFPWQDGWPSAVDRLPRRPFVGRSAAWFWETVCYIGWAPVLAAVLNVVLVIRRGRRPPAQWLFLTVAGVVALLLALPPIHDLLKQMPAMFLRSPSRQLYVTLFAASLGMGAACDTIGALARSSRGESASASRADRRRARRLAPPTPEASRATRALWVYGTLSAILVVHALDLGSHDMAFIRTQRKDLSLKSLTADGVKQEIGEARVAFDFILPVDVNRTLDDVGFFSAIALAGPYRVLVDLGRMSPNTNVETIDGADLDSRALAFLGVKAMMTSKQRPDLNFVQSWEASWGELRHYTVAEAALRAAFFPASAVLRLPADKIHARLRERDADLRSVLILTAGPDGNIEGPRTAQARPIAHDAIAQSPDARVAYSRPSSDEIEVSVTTSVAGYLRLLESRDRGWRATVDGKPAQIESAIDAFMAIALGPGTHRVRLAFHTPGVKTGAAISAGSLLLLLGLCASAWGGKTAGARPPATGATGARPSEAAAEHSRP